MKALVLAAVLAGLSPAALATERTDMNPPVAIYSTEGVEYLAGRWTGSTRDPGTGEAVDFIYTVQPAQGGRWLTGVGAARDGSFSSRDVWGRDPLTGEIIRMVFDGGGAFGTVRSRGWQGDRLVLEGEVRSEGGTLKVRETITRLGPDRFDAVWEAQRNGAWVPYAIETVTRERAS